MRRSLPVLLTTSVVLLSTNYLVGTSAHADGTPAAGGTQLWESRFNGTYFELFPSMWLSQ